MEAFCLQMKKESVPTYRLNKSILGPLITEKETKSETKKVISSFESWRGRGFLIHMVGMGARKSKERGEMGGRS